MSNELLQAAQALLAAIDGFNDQQAGIDALRQAVTYAEIEERDTIKLSWHISDVQDRRPDLTDEQAREVLQVVSRENDANLGVDWDFIDHWANELYQEPDNINELRDDVTQS